MAVGGAEFASFPMQSAAVATGNGTTMDVIVPGSGAFQTWAAQIKGITTATVTWEGTIDGTNWVGLLMTPTTSTTAALTATADGIYRGDVRGLVTVRARISAWTSGTITVTGVITAY